MYFRGDVELRALGFRVLGFRGLYRVSGIGV